MSKHKEIPSLAVVSSRGQLVIPLNLRKEMRLKEGSVVAISSSASRNTLIVKKINNPIGKEDMKIAKEVEDAWREIKSGKGKRQSKSEFLRDMKEW